MIGIKNMLRLSKFSLIFFIAVLLTAPALAQHKGAQHRGPSDLKEYIEALERPERDKEQKPDEVIKALNLDQYIKTHTVWLETVLTPLLNQASC